MQTSNDQINNEEMVNNEQINSEEKVVFIGMA